MRTHRGPPRGPRPASPGSPRALLGEHLERGHQARLVEGLPCTERAAVADEELLPSLPGVNGASISNDFVHRWERHPEAGESERRLDQPPPRQPPELPRELAEGGRQARDGARRRPERVDDDLVAERDRNLHELALPEGTAAKPSRFDTREPSNAMAWQPAEEPAHHRLSDAGGEAHRHDRVR